MVEVFYYKIIMDKHMPYFNLLDALKEKGCCICFLLKKTIDKLMNDFLYEQVNDFWVRNKIRESLGFCSLHAWQLQKLGDPLCSSAIYEDLMSIIVNQMEKIITAEKGMQKFLQKFLGGILRINREDRYRKTKIICPMCQSRREAEKRYISTFIEGFHEPEFFSAYRNSFGLCLPHLIETIKNCKEKKLIRLLLNTESEKMKNLIKELKEIQCKHDYRFSHEKIGRKGDAWIRAVEKMVGKESIF
jgi:hypothetical protein